MAINATQTSSSVSFDIRDVSLILRVLTQSTYTGKDVKQAAVTIEKVEKLHANAAASPLSVKVV